MPMLLEARPEQAEDAALVRESVTASADVVADVPKEQPESGPKKRLLIRDYCRQVPIVGIHTTCGEAANMLNHDKDNPCILLCDDLMQPVGMVMRETLYRLLNGRFAADLFYDKPLMKVADSSPVIVDVHADAKHMIDIALSRTEQHFYDCLIVTEEERLVGVLTVRDVMTLSRNLQHEASEERTATITESRQEMSRIHESITGLVLGASQTQKEAKRILSLSEQGEQSLMQVEASYHRVNRHMLAQREHAEDMLASIETGSSMAGSIRSLADQSGLLAMNASIEAAHAGEYGRGFQVVASEIRALAKQTREVAQNMSGLLEGIGELTRQTVELVRASAAEIEGSLGYVTEGETAFRELNNAVAGMSRIAEEIGEEGKRSGEVADYIRNKLNDMVSGNTPA